MMRKLLLIAFMSIVISAIIFLAFLFISAYSRKPSGKKIPYDTHLTYSDYDVMFALLRKMGYMVLIQDYSYEKKNIDCIVIDRAWNKKTFSSFKDWFGKNKRLVVFLDGKLNKKGREIFVKSKNPLLESVDKLSIHTTKNEKELYSPNKIRFESVLKAEGQMIIAKAAYREAEIILICDPYLFADKNMLKAGHAALLNNLFKKYFHKFIVFDRTPLVLEGKKAGEKSKEPQSFITKGHFPYLILQLVLLALVFYLVHYKRFGNILDYQKYKKRSIRNHLQAAANFLFNSGNKEVLKNILDDYFFEKLTRLFPGRKQEELIRELKKRYKNYFSVDLFSKNQSSQLVEIETQRQKFLNIIGKGEDYGKKNGKKKP
jgi:hypothetical protein